MIHSFDPNIAEKYGVNAAVLLNNIYFWVEKNRANGKHLYDGYCWTYNSQKAFSELFPYISEKQIRYALKRLIDDGILITGNYNKLAYDRTIWYAITKKGYSILQNCQMETAVLSNENGDIVEPIPDINTDNNTDNKTYTPPDSKDGKPNKNSNRSEINAQFDEFWKAYPRKVEKGRARKAFENAIKEASLDVLLKAVSEQKATRQWSEDNGRYIPHPTTWLNGKRWEDETTVTIEREERVYEDEFDLAARFR